MPDERRLLPALRPPSASVLVSLCYAVKLINTELHALVFLLQVTPVLVRSHKMFIKTLAAKNWCNMRTFKWQLLKQYNTHTQPFYGPICSPISCHIFFIHQLTPDTFRHLCSMTTWTRNPKIIWEEPHCYPIPHIYPQNCPFSFDDLHPHLIHPSLYQSTYHHIWHLDPFSCVATLHAVDRLTDRQTNWLTQGIGDSSVSIAACA